MNNKVFFVNLSEVESRLDPQYFFSKNNLHLANNTIFPVYPISQVLDLQRGKFGHRPRNDPKLYNGQYPFIQTGDIVKASLNNLPIEFHQTLNELGLKTSRLVSEKVVVLTIAANIGYTAILDYPACFPDSLIAIKPKKPQILELEYIDIYFKSIRQYLDGLAPQAAQKNINYQQLAKIPFVIPPKERQREIINLKQQNNILANQKLQQSQTLLNSISDYLLEQLGIVVPSVDNSLNNRLFMTSFSELDERLDPNYYQDNYNQAIVAIKSGKYKTMPLNQLTDSVFQGVGRNLVDFSNYKLLKVKNIQKNNKIDIDNFEYISEFSQSKILESGDIITPCIGEAVRQIKFSTFNYDENDKNMYLVDNNTGVIRPNSLIIPDFLTYCLCSFIGKMQISRLIGGGGVPFLGAENLKKFIIPVPDLPTQKSIVQHINQIRQQAQALEQEAIDLLKQTQDEIEMMILQ